MLILISYMNFSRAFHLKRQCYLIQVGSPTKLLIMGLFLIITFTLCHWCDTQNFLESQGLQNHSKSGLEIIFFPILLEDGIPRWKGVVDSSNSRGSQFWYHLKNTFKTHFSAPLPELLT